ncbi:MAG: hypothetical protein IKW60_02425 [Clostridia bacterium]|nr:hypothetical protein [Clostridia bacterium]
MQIGKFHVSKKAFQTVVLILVGLLSFFVVSKIAASPSLHASTIATLDEKKMEVIGLTGATAATSVAISAIPGDATTPIANEVANLSSYLLLVVCAIFLEKFLLTTTGFITFSIIVPIACLLWIGYIHKQNVILKIIALKLIAFGIAIVLIIPTSVFVSNIIDDVFDTKQKIAVAMGSSEEIDTATQNISEEEISGLQSFFHKVKEGLTNGITNAINKAEMALSNFVDVIAAFLVTACAIPIAVMVFFLWIIKVIFGVNVKMPKLKKHTFFKKKERGEEVIKELQEV